MVVVSIQLQTPHHQTLKSIPIIQFSPYKTTQFQGSRALRRTKHRPNRLNLLRCSASVAGEDGESLSAQPSSAAIDESLKLSVSGCKGCGREEMENGCNGEGRIQGGIATVAGFGWWPIKAYRPCPGFLAAGGRYQRQGQSMDEVAFGKQKVVETYVDLSTKLKSSKKKK